MRAFAEAYPDDQIVQQLAGQICAASCCTKRKLTLLGNRDRLKYFKIEK